MLSRRDIQLDGTEVLAVNSEGLLGYIPGE